LKYLLDQRLSTIPQHNWVSKLFGYRFMVEFKLGHLNAAADALSHHNEDTMMLHALSLPEFELYDKFCCEAASLPEIIAKRTEIHEGTAGPYWKIIDDIVLFKGRIFLPPSSTCGCQCYNRPMA
jgi:hypothetical protein